MKKIMTLLMCAMLVLSVVPSLATEDEYTDGEKLRGDGSVDDNSGTADDSKAYDRVQEEEYEKGYENADGYEYRVRVKDGELRERFRGNGMEVRQRMQANENAVEIRTRLRERYQAANERYANARAAYMEKKREIAVVKGRLAECAGDDSEACEQVRTRIKADIGPYLERSADMVLESLEKTKARIEASDLDEERKEELLAKLQERIDAMTAAKVAAGELDDDAAMEEVREATEGVRNAWGQTQRTMKVGLGVSVAARVGSLVRQTERLGERLDMMLEKLEERGLDTTVADVHVAEFEENVANAKMAWEEAKAAYDEADSATSFDGLVREANQNLREARRSLLAARDSLREAVRTIKRLNQDALPDDSPDGSDADEAPGDDSGEDANAEADEANEEADNTENSGDDSASDENQTAVNTTT